MDAMYVAQKEYDMLSSWLGRNGFNGSGGAPPIRVGLADVNAYWNGSYVNFGHSRDNARQATSADVVGHELGHAIFQYTPGGAGSSKENGGINEATGDIFGALTEAYINAPSDPPDYTVGERVNLVGNGPIRYMYQPSLEGDPNCYTSAIPNAEVHAAAGPLNHWFYLAAEGSAPSGKPASPTCNGSFGHRHQPPQGRQDLLQRPAGQDVHLALRQRAGGHAERREEPLPRQLHRVQRGQGGLGRGERAGPVGRAHLHRVRTHQCGGDDPRARHERTR